MTNKTLYIALSLIVFVLSVRLFTTATAHSMWREFWVSEAQVIVTALALAVLLKRQT